MIIDSPIISGSYAASGSLNQVGNVVISGSLTITGGVTGSISGSAISASYAANATTASFALNVPQTASFAISASNAATASYLSNYIPPFPFTGSAGISGSLIVNGNITAQTLIVQTVTSSVDFVTGSTRFGSEITNTHQFTGSVTMSGSLAVSGPSSATLFMNPQTLGDNVVVPSGYNALVLGPVDMSSSIEVGSGSNLIILENFTNLATTGSNSFTGNQTITGSLNVTQGITGSLLGTASFANTATSSSFASTASFSLNVPVTSSYANNATSASFATTASYLTGYISPFPYTGSAIISGSLTVTGSAAVSNLQGTGVRYLVADASGSITAQTASAAIKQTQAFTSSANQTSFTIDNGYTTGLVDVFINGTKLAPGVEFTDTTGTVITLATGSNSGDLVEFVKYFPASGVTNNALRQLTTFTASAGQTVFSASYTPGLLDIFYNGSRLSNNEYTANNGTFFTLATGSVDGDILDVFVYSYQVGAFSGIGGAGVASQVAYFGTTNAITGSPNFTISGSTMLITGSLIVSGSGTFTNIGPAVMSGSLNISGSLIVGGSNVVLSNQTSSLNVSTASFAATASSADNLLVRNTLTAQTLVVQTITSSVVYSSGSNIFGNNISNTQTFTGSILSNGGIGIGTSTITSGYSLDVNGPSYFRSTTVITGSGGTYLSIRTTSSADAAVFMFDGANTGYVGLNVGSNPNKFIIYYAADTRMAIDTSGRVGFGTSSPGYNLEINSGSSAPTELAIVNTNAAGAARLSLRNTERDFILTSNTADDLLSFAYGGSNRLQFHTSSQWFNSGNVGIGTSSPGEQLTLSRSSYPTIKFIDTTDNFSGYLQYHTEANEFRLLTITNHPLIFSTNDTEKMRIAAGGNVGIGTNNPSYLLHLQQATGNPAIFIKRVTNDTNFEISVQESRTRLRTWSTANDRDFFFDTDNAGTTRMIITGAGRVGIGVTAPDAGLQIAAPAQDDQLTLGSAANNRDHAAFIYSGGNKAEFLRYQSGVRLIFGSSGNIQNVDIVPGGSVGVRLSAGNTSWSAYTSDERKKKNFETVPGLEALLQINPVKYHFKTQDDSEIKKLGFIAQNIQPLIPEMVHSNGEKAEDGTDILTIIPDYILPVLVKAIQEQQTLITALEEKLERNNII